MSRVGRRRRFNFPATTEHTVITETPATAFSAPLFRRKSRPLEESEGRGVVLRIGQRMPCVVLLIKPC